MTLRLALTLLVMAPVAWACVATAVDIDGVAQRFFEGLRGPDTSSRGDVDGHIECAATGLQPTDTHGTAEQVSNPVREILPFETHTTGSA